MFEGEIRVVDRNSVLLLVDYGGYVESSNLPPELRDALRLSGLHNTFSPAVLPRTHAKKPIRQDGLLHFI